MEHKVVEFLKEYNKKEGALAPLFKKGGMQSVRVRFFATIRDLTGCAEADIPYQDTAGTLARALCSLYGENLGQKFFPAGLSGRETFGPEIIVLINGRHVKHLQGTATPLNPDDRVDIFPLVAGG